MDTREPSEDQSFGGLDDDRFPSPRRLRRALAYVFDVVLHVVIGFGMYFVASPAIQSAVAHREWDDLQVDPMVLVGWFVAASFLDRVVLQAISHTTLGKAVFGLVVIDRESGRYPRPARLLAAWLFGLVLFVLAVGDGPDLGRTDRYVLPSVRRRDIGATRSSRADAGDAGPSPATDAPIVRDAVNDGIIRPR